MKFIFAVMLTSFLVHGAYSRAEALSGVYQMKTSSCIPNYPDIVRPITVKIVAENYRLSFSTPVQSEFSDVGIFDMPVDYYDVGSATSGSGVTYLRQSGAYSAGGSQFKFSLYDDHGLLRYASFSLSSNGTLTIKHKRDQDPKTRTCVGVKIQ